VYKAEKQAKIAKELVAAEDHTRRALAGSAVRAGHEEEDKFRNQFAGRNLNPAEKQAYDAQLARQKQLDSKNVAEAYDKEVRLMTMKEQELGKYGVELAKQQSYNKAILEGKTVAQALDLSNRAGKGEMAKQEADYAKALKKTQLEQGLQNEELIAAANPLNDHIQETLRASKAYSEWALSHPDLVAAHGEEQKAIFKSNEELKTHLKYVQEATKLNQQYAEPFDKMIQAQIQLNKARETGKLTDRAFQKASAEEYGKAHKEYTEQFKAGHFDAMSTTSPEAASSLQDYRMGMTAIPGGMGEDKNNPEQDMLKESQKQTVLLTTLVTQGGGGDTSDDAIEAFLQDILGTADF
jgi:hypothetical protein